MNANNHTHDLDEQLSLLSQRFADAGFVLRTVLELRQSADRLLAPLTGELRTIRQAIDHMLSTLEGDAQ